MGALLNFIYFDSKGYLVHSGQTTLPDSLDWKSIEEKEVFIRYMGGMPDNASHLLLKSQGQQRLITDLDSHKGGMDHLTYRTRYNGHEGHLEERCSELGIDRSRKPRNQ